MPDEETYSKGMFSLTEWEDVNYCDHYFRVNDKGLTDKEVVDLLYELNKENKKLKQFKQSVFNLIDKSLEKDKQYYEMSYEDYLNGRIEALKDLKKELQE